MFPFLQALIILLILVSASLAKTSLWKVHGKKNTVYLLGSVHVLSKDSYPLDPAIDRAFDESPNLVFEMNLDSGATPAAQKYILSKAMFKNEQTLQTSLSNATFQLADSLCGTLGLQIERFLLFKPWMVSTTIMMVKLQQMGLNPQYGIDKYYFEKGKQAQKSISGFESLQEQINFIDGLPLKIQDKMILQMAEEFNAIEKDIKRIINAWRKGNMQQLEQFFLESYKQEPELHQVLLIQRNQKWIKKIHHYLNGSKNHLIIVGVGHMVGENGLLKMLEKDGYTVTQQ